MTNDEHSFLITHLVNNDFKVSDYYNFMNCSKDHMNSLIKSYKKHTKDCYGDDDRIMQNSEIFSNYKLFIKVITLLRLRNSAGKIFTEEILDFFRKDYVLALIGYLDARYEGYDYKLFSVGEDFEVLESIARSVKESYMDLSIYAINPNEKIDYDNLKLVKQIATSGY